MNVTIRPAKDWPELMSTWLATAPSDVRIIDVIRGALAGRAKPTRAQDRIAAARVMKILGWTRHRVAAGGTWVRVWRRPE